LMRISPVGLFAAGRPELAARLAAEDGKIAHPHPTCVGACMSFATAIAVGVAGGSLDELFTAALGHAGAFAVVFWEAKTIRDGRLRSTGEAPEVAI
jgi:ADP-ribosyl-[dinitrogen reductase] hydrolase